MGLLRFLIDQAFWIYEWLIIASLIMSWFRPSPYHPAVRMVYKLTEPVLEPARRLIPPIGGFDFSPILVFIVLGWARRLILTILFTLG